MMMRDEKDNNLCSRHFIACSLTNFCLFCSFVEFSPFHCCLCHCCYSPIWTPTPKAKAQRGQNKAELKFHSIFYRSFFPSGLDNVCLDLDLDLLRDKSFKCFFFNFTILILISSPDALLGNGKGQREMKKKRIQMTISLFHRVLISPLPNSSVFWSLLRFHPTRLCQSSKTAASCSIRSSRNWQRSTQGTKRTRPFRNWQGRGGIKTYL